MDKAKERLIDIGEVILLSTLIVIRIFIPSEENTWISLLNYIGLLLAVVSLYIDIYGEFSEAEKISVVTGVFILVLAILIIIAALILTELIVLNTKCNDIVLLLTLLVSLPTRLYKSLIQTAVTA